VLDAYSWPHEIAAAEILAQRLALMLEQAVGQVTLRAANSRWMRAQKPSAGASAGRSNACLLLSPYVMESAPAGVGGALCSGRGARLG
jgi:hypothetical protein